MVRHEPHPLGHIVNMPLFTDFEIDVNSGWFICILSRVGCDGVREDIYILIYSNHDIVYSLPTSFGLIIKDQN